LAPHVSLCRTDLTGLWRPFDRLRAGSVRSVVYYALNSEVQLGQRVALMGMVE